MLPVQRPSRTEMPTYSRLTREQRYTIEAMNRNGSDQKAIAEAIGKHPSTVSRELRRWGEASAYDHANLSGVGPKTHLFGGLFSGDGPKIHRLDNEALKGFPTAAVRPLQKSFRAPRGCPKRATSTAPEATNSCATPVPRSCWRAGPTSASSSSPSAMKSSRRPPFTRSSASNSSRTSTAAPTRPRSRANPAGTAPFRPPTTPETRPATKATTTAAATPPTTAPARPESERGQSRKTSTSFFFCCDSSKGELPPDPGSECSAPQLFAPHRLSMPLP
jgi:hypothetical protein